MTACSEDLGALAHFPLRGHVSYDTYIAGPEYSAQPSGPIKAGAFPLAIPPASFLALSDPARLPSPGRLYQLRVIIPPLRGLLTAVAYDGGALAPGAGEAPSQRFFFPGPFLRFLGPRGCRLPCAEHRSKGIDARVGGDRTRKVSNSWVPRDARRGTRFPHAGGGERGKRGKARRPQCNLYYPRQNR
jgi:hypothetical protein